MTGGVELKPDASKTDIIYQEQVTNNVDELNNDLIASNNPIYDNVKNS
jgi:hypothetical protein